MNRNYVNSSMIVSIGYDKQSSVLEIEFKSNQQVWNYFDVPEYLYNELMASESQGKFFLANIKNKYRESRV